MNELSVEKTMTVREVSEILEVSEKHIRHTIDKIYPNKLKNGIKTYLKEEEVTAIKLYIQKNPYLDQSVELPKTNLEKKLIIKQAIMILNEEIENLKEENSKLKDQNELVQKRVNLLIHNSKTYTSTEIAKELNLRSALELNKILSEKGVQFKVNKTWVLHAKYSDCDYESIKSEELDNGRVVYNRHWTGKGRDFIVNLLRGEL